MPKKIIRIATRNSPLALLQSNFIKKKLLCFYPHLIIKLIPIVTRGDIILHKSLSNIGGKGLFIKELELALLENKADIAVHSMKDIPNTLPPGLCLSSICKRGNALDALVSNHYKSIDHLPKRAIIGTSSLRRKSQLIRYRPDLIIYPLRGNIHTRLKKLDDGHYTAIILSAEGLNRLGLKKRISQIIPAELSLPPCGQGAIGVEYRSSDLNIAILLRTMQDKNTEIIIKTERAFCKKMNSGCQIPVASYAILSKKKLWLRGLVCSPDGKIFLSGQRVGNPHVGEEMGNILATELLNQGALKILKNIFSIK
ncbi:MAG TPA: hydroxymethylbilane synthase [Buchnera sp. (in: enterobacteria)]|nr:hydroxymethylbilane synthase [Buchnera sp. (in: enterobacteria)]